jgi:hypothetical protein
MTKYEQKNNTSDRFIIVYSLRKMIYLKENGHYYLFECFNKNSKCNFWVFDMTPEIKVALSEYVPYNRREQ